MLSLSVERQLPASEEQQVDDAISEFNSYFKGIQNDTLGDRLDLTGPEVALIKTFCAYMFGHGPHNPRHVSSQESTADASKNSR
jgi:hypothetical protein